MLTTTQEFISASRADLRELTWGVRMSFDKVFDDNITFFTIGTSLIGGGDFIKGASADVVQEWDKYTYTDYSDRLISMEWSNQVDLFASVTMAMADITLDNHDDYFTPNGGSAIASYILPYRPIRLYAGFGDELIPVFIGITEKMPIVDEKSKTVTFHCIDFMFTLLNRPLLEASLYVDQTTDAVIEGLFAAAGITAVQLDLDSGLSTIPFGFFEKGGKLGDAIKQLMVVEQGRIYMDGIGVIHFKNRQNYSDTSLYTFDAYHNINNARTKTQDDLINVVEIKGPVREVQPKQRFWKLPSYITVPASGSVDVWADFQDPVTSCDTPVYVDSVVTSFYEINDASDGSGTDSTDVTLTSSTLFGKSYKMTFTNAGTSILYITNIELFATPASVIENIYVRVQDDTSVGKYDERILTIDNPFFGSAEEAQTRAQVIINDYATFGGANEIEVKGIMSLEVDDTVTVNVFDRIDDYKISKIVNKITLPAKFTQILTVRNFQRYHYFTIGSSYIGGTDQLAP